MNENWPEIVETLIPYFETNSVEGDYQREIENCLKFLGWKKTNGTMVSQYTLPIGNARWPGAAGGTERLCRKERTVSAQGGAV